jgi:PPOX class probable F420-dependent enzyme
MPTTLSDDVRRFLELPNPAVMATLAADGRPISAATWYLLEPDGRILINMKATRVRLGHVRRDPRFSLTVLKADDWYTHVSLQCVTTEIADDPQLAGIDALSKHYTGEAYDERDQQRFDVRADIVSVLKWGELG